MGTSTNLNVGLAEKSVRHFIQEGKPLPCPDDLPENLRQKAGAFVSIKKKKKLRGCIGTLKPRERNLAHEIIQNAISAATKDPRFSPVSKEELDDLTISVDVISALEKVDSLSQLDAKVYGVVVKNEGKQGVLLPDLEGIESPEEQIQICRMKANIKEEDPVELYRFTVQRYT